MIPIKKFIPWCMTKCNARQGGRVAERARLARLIGSCLGASHRS
jgi:hypothetical protein